MTARRRAGRQLGQRYGWPPRSARRPGTRDWRPARAWKVEGGKTGITTLAPAGIEPVPSRTAVEHTDHSTTDATTGARGMDNLLSCLSCCLSCCSSVLPSDVACDVTAWQAASGAVTPRDRLHGGSARMRDFPHAAGYTDGWFSVKAQRRKRRWISRTNFVLTY